MLLKRKAILYFAPHQDDELLSMGVNISTSVLSGHDVHVILCTDGSKSNSRLWLNNGETCPHHGGAHIYELSIAEFIQARDREFTDSCRALGVKPANIHIPENRGVDGSLSAEHAEKIIRHYLSVYGADAMVCTISPNNGPSQHRDHKALGKAAENLVNKGVINGVRFFVEPYHFAQICENPRLIPVEPTIQKASPQVKEKIKKAIAAYSYWNPAELRYAVGYHSVTTEFSDFLQKINSCYFMKRNAKAMTRFEKISQQHRKWRKLQKQNQLYYSMSNCAQPDLGALKLISIQANETAAYQDFCQKYKVPLRDKDCQRLSDGSSFWCLVSGNGAVVSSGWLAYQQHFYIGETDYGFDMSKSKTAILFDFNTKAEHRGKGYYGLLLRSIVHQSKGPARYVIYTSPDNNASSRGILKAGFQYDGALSASDRSMNRYLRKEGFTSITRKNQLWGLRVLP